MAILGYNYTSVNQIVDRGATVIAHGLSNSTGGAITMNHSTPQLSALKVCSKCGEAKPLTEYSVYRTGTYKTHCKDCAAAYARQRRVENPERARAIKNAAYARNRERNNAAIRERIASDPEYAKRRNERTRKWREKNLDQIARWRQEYYAKNGELVRKYSRDIKFQQPEKYKARYLVSSAVLCGRIPPAWTMVCEHCQEAQAAEWHHHKGYGKEHALDVIALCKKCHGKERRVL